MRIAMWSGPRNLSTAMMYAFAARDDFAVWDEPYYGAYLQQTKVDHPLKDKIIANVETDASVVDWLHLAPTPRQKQHYYLKEMAHHMLPNTPRIWLPYATHVFLIRHPAYVIASYTDRHQGPTAEDIGYEHQLRLYDEIAAVCKAPPLVIDASDILKNPSAMLRKLCSQIGLAFTDQMLAWPAGGNACDGPWAEHWYQKLWQSTGFEKNLRPVPTLHGDNARLLQETLPIYEQLRALAI